AAVHGTRSACEGPPWWRAARQARLKYRKTHSLMATKTFPTRDDFETMLNESLGGENETFEGKVVKGIVTGIENDLAVIDVGLKSEGRVPLREFAAPGQKAELKIGDEVEVYVDRVENSQREAMLSRDRDTREAGWDKLEGE